MWSIGPHHVAAWKARQISIKDPPLAQFYTKYWGMSMKKEVNKWQQSTQDEDMGCHIDSGEMEMAEKKMASRRTRRKMRRKKTKMKMKMITSRAAAFLTLTLMG